MFCFGSKFYNITKNATPFDDLNEKDYDSGIEDGVTKEKQEAHEKNELERYQKQKGDNKEVVENSLKKTVYHYSAFSRLVRKLDDDDDDEKKEKTDRQKFVEKAKKVVPTEIETEISVELKNWEIKN